MTRVDLLNYMLTSLYLNVQDGNDGSGGGDGGDDHLAIQRFLTEDNVAWMT